MKNLVIKQDRPLHMLLALAAAIVLLSTLTWLVLDKSHWAFIMAKLSGNQHMREILQVNRELEDENKKLKDKVLWLERNRGIDKEATMGLRDQLVKLQDDFYKQKGELEFYNGIMSTTQYSLGLNVQGLHIENIGDDNIYRYRLILTNVTKSDKIIEGTAHIVVIGELGGKKQKYSFGEISASEENKWKFKFKNFKRFEGNIVLPEGFSPKRVAVELLSKGKREKMAERSFEWLNIVS